MKYLRFIAAITCIVFALSSLGARADSTGALRGSVTDVDGTPIASARVTLQGARRDTTATDASGAFRFSALPAGTYGVSVAKAGYGTATLDGVAVGDGETAVVIALLHSTLSSIREIANVTSAKSGVFNATPSAQAILTAQRFGDLGQIGLANVLNETPGAVNARPGSANAAAYGSITSPNIRGALDYEKATLIDGHPLINGAKGDYPTMLLNMFVLDDVEVVKGPTAFAPQINYAIGGMMNFRTAEPTRVPSGSALYGLDGFGGTFSNLRYAGTTNNGKFSWILDYATYGTPGADRNVQSYVTLPSGSKINGVAIAGTNSGTPINGTNGNYPIGGSVLGNPTNAYTTLVACCQSVNSDFLNKMELVKFRYNFSSATTATIAYIGNQSQYDGAAAGFTQLGAVFAPTGTYSGAGLALQPDQGYLLNNKTVLPDSRLYDNEPIFEADLRSTVGSDAVLARFYSAILARQTTTDISNPNADYTTGLTLFGTGKLGAVNNAPFDGTFENVTVPTPYSNSVEHDDLHGYSFEYDHPTGPNMLTFSVDRTTSLTNAYAIAGATAPVGGKVTVSIPGGTRQDFTTYLLRGTFNLDARTTLTLANYYNTYHSVYTPSKDALGNFVYQSGTVAHDDPRMGLTYRPNGNLSLRFSAGSAVAPAYPSLIDNLNTTPLQAYNPAVSTVTIAQNSGSLLPETSFGYNVGGDYRLPSGAILSLDAYLTDLRNQFIGITYPTGTLYTPPVGPAVPIYVSTNENLAKARFQGIEFSLKSDPAFGLGYTISGDLARAFAYDLPPGFYSSVAGPYTTNLGVIDGANYVGFNSPAFNGISNKSEAYSQGYGALHYRGAHHQYFEFGVNYFGPNNTYNVPAFVTTNAAFGLPVFNEHTRATIAVDNLFGAYTQPWALVNGGVPTPLANNYLGLRTQVPVGPTTIRFSLSHAF